MKKSESISQIEVHLTLQNVFIKTRLLVSPITCIYTSIYLVIKHPHIIINLSKGQDTQRFFR